MCRCLHQNRNRRARLCGPNCRGGHGQWVQRTPEPTAPRLPVPGPRERPLPPPAPIRLPDINIPDRLLPKEAPYVPPVKVVPPEYDSNAIAKKLEKHDRDPFAKFNAKDLYYMRIVRDAQNSGRPRNMALYPRSSVGVVKLGPRMSRLPHSRRPPQAFIEDFAPHEHPRLPLIDLRSKYPRAGPRPSSSMQPEVGSALTPLPKQRQAPVAPRPPPPKQHAKRVTRNVDKPATPPAIAASPQLPSRPVEVSEPLRQPQPQKMEQISPRWKYPLLPPPASKESRHVKWED